MEQCFWFLQCWWRFPALQEEFLIQRQVLTKTIAHPGRSPRSAAEFEGLLEDSFCPVGCGLKIGPAPLWCLVLSLVRDNLLGTKMYLWRHLKNRSSAGLPKRTLSSNVWLMSPKIQDWIRWSFWQFCLHQQSNCLLRLSSPLDNFSILTLVVIPSLRWFFSPNGGWLPKRYVIPYVTAPKWITHLRPFMARHNFRITLSHPWEITLQSENDRFLLEIFSGGKISDFKLFHINCCCQYFQVMTLAGNATADGNSLCPETLECKRFRDRKSPLAFLTKSGRTYKTTESRLEVCAPQPSTTQNSMIPTLNGLQTKHREMDIKAPSWLSIDPNSHLQPKNCGDWKVQSERYIPRYPPIDSQQSFHQ